MISRKPLFIAAILTSLISRGFRCGKECAYCLSWDELRALSRNPELSESDLPDIKRYLHFFGNSLVDDGEWLVVDRADSGLYPRMLTRRMLKEYCSYSDEEIWAKDTQVNFCEDDIASWLHYVNECVTE